MPMTRNHTHGGIESEREEIPEITAAMSMLMATTKTRVVRFSFKVANLESLDSYRSICLINFVG